jgi:hypothetical protein
LRTVGVALLLAACGGGGGATPDASSTPPIDSGVDPGDAGAGPCDAPATWADTIAPTTALHVATTGTAGGDGSAGDPFATIEQAAAAATPGTAIVVHAGTYAGGIYLEGLAGTAAAPIWIGGAPGEAVPVITGGGDGIHLSRVRYVALHDLEITGATGNGVNLDDGGDYDDPTATQHVVLQHLFVHDIGAGGNQDCLKLSGVHDFFVYDNQIERCGGGGSGSGLDHVGCHRGIIARNTFTETSGNAIQAKGGSTDLDIRQNHMVQSGARAVNMGGSTGFEFFRPPLSTTEPNAEARDIRVTSNVIVGGDAALAFVGCVDCLAAGNTIIDPLTWPFRILQETVTGGGYTFEPARDGRVIGNLVYFEAGEISTHVNVGANTAPETFTFANNLWYAHDDAGQSTPTLPVTETGAVIGMDPGDPQSDCHGGPRDDRGQALPELPGDLRGTCRAQAPDIGAIETHSCTD